MQVDRESLTGCCFNKSTISCNGQIIDLSHPVIMGIINLTPDSFYTQSRYNNEYDILRRTEAIITEGGTIVDIGACSTRPGSALISENEELERIFPAVASIRRHFPEIILSVDTFRSKVVKKIISETGECIINDISAGLLDPEMFETITELQVPYILMHMQGNPSDMQVKPEYKDVVTDIISFFNHNINILQNRGLHDIIIDPGFGFGKTTCHNFQLLNRLDTLRIFGLPVLAGLSRKSMIFKLLNCSPDEALTGTIALNTIALLKGVNILRVHDVKEATEIIQIVQKYYSCSE